MIYAFTFVAVIFRTILFNFQPIAQENVEAMQVLHDALLRSCRLDAFALDQVIFFILYLPIFLFVF